MWIHINEVLNRAMARVTTAAADFLPGLLALLIILFFATVVAFVVRVAIRRSLERAEFDRRIDQWGLSRLAEWYPARSPTLLMARIGFWTVVLLGLLVIAILVTSYGQIILNRWNQPFYDAITRRDLNSTSSWLT